MKRMNTNYEYDRIFYYVSAGCAQFFKGEQKITNLLSLDEGSITISATETALHCCLLQWRLLLLSIPYIPTRIY